jgi:hypothetical protein
MNLPSFLGLTAAILFASHGLGATLSTSTLSDAGYDLVTWNTWKGQSFTLAANTAPSMVTSVTLRLEVIVPNATMIVRIVGSGSAPGQPNMADIRAELRPAALAAGTAVEQITFESDPGQAFPPLDPDATYWIVAGMTDQDNDQALPAGLVRWHYAGAHGQDPSAEPGWAVASKVSSSGTAGTDWISSTETPYSFSMVAVPIPEPATASMLLSVALVSLGRRRSP